MKVNGVVLASREDVSHKNTRGGGTQMVRVRTRVCVYIPAKGEREKRDDV